MTAIPGRLVLEGHLRTYRHQWRGSIAAAFLNPVLYLAALGLGLGTLVDQNRAAALGDLTYVEFLAPGVLAATAMSTAATDTSWPVMAAFKWLRTYEAALATPQRPRDLLLGRFGWVFLRLLLATSVFVLVAALLGAMPLGLGVLAIAPALLTGLAFAGLIVAYTTRLKNETGLAGLFRFGILPVFLFSGTFFPIDQLPDVIEPLAWFVPLWHGVELTRGITTEVAMTAPAALHVAALLAFIAIGLVLADRGYHHRLVT